MPDGPPADPLARKTFRAKLARLIAGAAEEPQAQPHADPGAPDASPRALRLRVTEFDSATVADVMSSRAEISAIEVSATLGEALKHFADEAHSRIPVYREELDEPVGFVHIKDIVGEVARLGWGAATLECRPLDRLKREILFVTGSMRLPDLLVRMQSTRIHIALVVDEYGGIDGVVCLEDLVEQIVGDIEDEHDEAPPPIVRKGRNTWEIDALAEIDAVERETRLSLSVEEHEADVGTLGGLATALAGRVPAVGEVIEHPLGHRLEVIEADPRRIVRLKLRAAGAPKPARVAERADAGHEVAQAAQPGGETAGEPSREAPRDAR
jgi:CBS domain containing-hemolysin-like protein